MTCRTSALTVLLCYFTYLREPVLKIMIIHLLYTSTAVNLTKAVIEILQGSTVAQTVQGWLIVVSLLLCVCSANNYENLLIYVKDISEDKSEPFLRRCRSISTNRMN